MYIGLDLLTAFDSIDHDIILSVLENRLGIGHCVLSFIGSHLNGRSQKLLIVDNFSPMQSVKTGIFKVQF